MINVTNIVIAPGNARVTEVSSDGVIHIPIRQARRFDEFAAALGRWLGVSAVVPEAENPVPGHGTLVVCRPDVLYWLEEAGCPMLSWVVVVDLDRIQVLERAESLGLAATVEVEDYYAWTSATGRPATIYGRKKLAEPIGAALDMTPLHSTPRYARMVRAEVTDLPGLLADYLLAYFKADLADP